MISNFQIKLDKATSFNLGGSSGILVVGRSEPAKNNLTAYIMLRAMRLWLIYC